LEVPNEEEEESYFIPLVEELEEEIYFIPLIEELEEEVENPIEGPYIRSKSSTMEGEGEVEVHNLNREFRVGGEIGNGRRGRVGGRGGGGGRGGRGEPKPFGFPILDEDTIVTMKNISPSILPNFHGVSHEDPKTFLFEFEVLCRSYDYLFDSQKLKY